jgi:hypothetical protein
VNENEEPLHSRQGRRRQSQLNGNDAKREFERVRSRDESGCEKRLMKAGLSWRIQVKVEILLDRQRKYGIPQSGWMLLID